MFDMTMLCHFTARHARYLFEESDKEWLAPLWQMVRGERPDSGPLLKRRMRSIRQVGRWFLPTN